MKQVGQIAGGVSTRFGRDGAARGARVDVARARVVDRGGASARKRAVRSASPKSATTAGNHSDAGIRVYTPDRCCTCRASSLCATEAVLGFSSRTSRATAVQIARAESMATGAPSPRR